MTKVLPFLGICCLLAQPAAAQPAVATSDFDPLVAELQAFVATADPQRFLALLAPDADELEARAFASRTLQDDVTRAVVLARFVLPAEDYPEGSRYNLTVEAFTESGNRARLQTWQLEVGSGAPHPEWPVAAGVSPATRDPTRSTDSTTLN